MDYKNVQAKVKKIQLKPNHIKITMKTGQVIALFLSALICVSGTNGATPDPVNTCGDWQPYKEEKCLKIFEGPGLLNFADAEAFCKDQDGAQLLSVPVREKQEFIETFLNSSNVVDYVWIGLKYVNGTYQWSEGSSLQYTNWANGSPKNNSDYCVQMETEPFDSGVWSDVSCSKKNLVICEKIQLWSMSQLQEAVLDLIKNPVPVGFIYVQLPKEKSPMEIWPSMEWKDVSEDYAGIFFRAKGGNAAPFGEVQEEDSPRITHMETGGIFSGKTTVEEIDLLPNNKPSDMLKLTDIPESSYGESVMYMKVTESDAEVRPRNMAMQIWKRMK